MGNDANQLASETTQQAMELERRQYNLGASALGAGTDYLTRTYKAGGTSILDPKFNAMRTDALEASGAATGSMGDVGSILQARALGQSGVANQRLTAGLDEMNKLRSLLSSHGLQTTNLGAAGQGESLAALSLMPKNPTLSGVLAGGAGAAAVYGGLKQAGQPGQGPSLTSIAPTATSAFGAPGMDPTLGVGTSSYFSRPQPGMTG